MPKVYRIFDTLGAIRVDEGPVWFEGSTCRLPKVHEPGLIETVRQDLLSLSRRYLDFTGAISENTRTIYELF